MSSTIYVGPPGPNKKDLRDLFLLVPEHYFFSYVPLSSFSQTLYSDEPLSLLSFYSLRSHLSTETDLDLLWVIRVTGWV